MKSPSSNKFLFLKISFILSIVLFYFYCSKSDKNEESKISSIQGIIYNRLSAFNPIPLLSNLSTNIILKGYSDLETAANEFNTAAQSYSGDCSNNASSLQNLQTSWKKNFAILKQLEIIQFGPAQFGGFYESIDPWVANYTDNITPDTTSINSFISGSTTINTTNVTVLNKLLKGLPAIEYLLFSDSTGNTSLTSTCSGLTGRRMDFMKQLVSLYYTATQNLHSQWKTSGSNYANELPTAGSGSIYFSSQKAAMDILILQFSNHIEFIRDNKLGYPAGLTTRSGGTKRPTVIETRFANQPISNLVNNLNGVNSLYTGVNGQGISDYIRSANPSLDSRIRQQITTCISNVQKISDLQVAINSNSSDVLTAYNSLTTLRNMLTTEVTATFGASGASSGGSGDGD
jgi:predicted lipoprotein